jgi:tRNA pseudouridine55 synthase
MSNGFLIINKESGMTSHDVVNKIRKTFQTKQVGHTGTLDPNATGVLIVAVGKATKAISYLENDDKIYEAELTLGIITDTEDIWGNVIEEKEVTVSEEKIEQTIKSFIGDIKQVPPMYSALKVNGKKLYELAREGVTIEREARDITIFDIYDIIVTNNKVKFTVHCSKGTYIRTLCKDIGEKLGCGACMSGLNRIKVGGFDIKNSKTIDNITENDLIDLEEPLQKYQAIYLENDEGKKYMNGVKIKTEENDGLYRIYLDNNFFGIGKIEKGILKSAKCLITT